MLHISGINYESIADAEGVAVTIFFSGCKHKCYNCHSKETWNFNNGKPIDQSLIDMINSEIDKRDFLSSLVLSGGDPMYSAKEVLNFINKIHIPNNNVWCYTGFNIEEVLSDDEMSLLLFKCNVLIDGKFDYSKRDITLKFKGSSNQRVIDVQKTLKNNKIELYYK